MASSNEGTIEGMAEGLTERVAEGMIEGLMKAKQMLDESKRPLYFFDDDPDGLCSFLLAYRYKREGKGVIVKMTPELKHESFLKAIEYYEPDLILILDKPMVSQDFLDAIKEKFNLPVIWIDHHGLQDRKNVFYLNPKKWDAKNGLPTTYWVWQMVKKNIPDDVWIAGTGTVSDWFLPDDEICTAMHGKYPYLLNPKFRTPQDALFSKDSRIGLLSRILSFNLKGTAHDALISARIMTRIRTPNEILLQETSQGRFIYKRFQKLNGEYHSLLHSAKPERGKFLVFTYDEDTTAFTADLSNELLYKHPRKIIVVARLNRGEYKIGFRADARYSKPVDAALKKALEGIDGYGGGHPYACGGCIKENEFEKFIGQLKKAVSTQGRGGTSVPSDRPLPK